jgi:hypothetical protein
MVRNPNKTRAGENIIGGVPDHIDVIFRKEPRIWFAEVNDRNGNMMDTERYEGGMRQSYVEDSGNRNGAIRMATDIAKHHDIPVNIFSGGRVVKKFKPPF